MFEVPRAYGSFDRLLKLLGAAETAAPTDYFRFLYVDGVTLLLYTGETGSLLGLPRQSMNPPSLKIP